MKKIKKWGAIVAVVVVVTVILGLAIPGSGMLPFAHADENTIQPAPTVVVWPPVVKIHSKTDMAIMGSGFEPGQELYIVIPDMDGSTTNIVDVIEPAPEGMGIMVDERGNFAVLWTIGRLERSTAEGVADLVVTDLSYNALASTPVGFADPAGRCRFRGWVPPAYPRGAPDYAENPDDPRPLPWLEPFFEYPERP